MHNFKSIVIPAVYVGTLNLIASIPGPSILTFQSMATTSVKFRENLY